VLWRRSAGAGERSSVSGTVVWFWRRRLVSSDVRLSLVIVGLALATLSLFWLPLSEFWPDGRLVRVTSSGSGDGFYGSKATSRLALRPVFLVSGQGWSIIRTNYIDYNPPEQFISDPIPIGL